MKKLLFSAAVLAVTALQAQDCSDLFFSEYVEGKLHNKALEVYNPTADAIDLSNYSVKRYSNGSTDNNGRELILSGSISSHDVVVITHGDTIPNEGGNDSYIELDLYNLGDLHGTGEYANSPMFFNGNDAITLEKLDGTIVDVFGKVGEDPDNGWNDDASTGYQAGADYWKSWTKDHIMVRKYNVQKGVDVNPAAGFNAGLEYDSLTLDAYATLGSHDCKCAEPLSINENTSFSFIAYSNNKVLTISSKEALSKVELINFNGQVVETVSVNGNSFQMATNVSAGTYILRLVSDVNSTATSKIIIK